MSDGWLARTNLASPRVPPRRCVSFTLAALARLRTRPRLERAVPGSRPRPSLCPQGIVSARILKADQPILAAPWEGSPRRGSAALDVHLPIFAVRRGPGCKGRFLSVGPIAWVCEDAVELAETPFVDAAYRAIRQTADGLPFRYYFVGPDGSFAYKKLHAVDVGAPDMQLEPGFAVAIVEERVVEGARYGRSHNELWMPMRDLGPARPLAFRGEEIPRNAPDRRAPLRVDRRRQSEGALDAERPRQDGVEPRALRTSCRSSRRKTRAARASADRRGRVGPLVGHPPSDDRAAAARGRRRPRARSGSTWISRPRRSWRTRAKRPVFATLVSTGKGREGSATATPRGTSRIWVKLFTSNMDNLEDEDATRYYRMEDVPWVQFFAKGVGLHGAFWHRSFGHVRSHGCVNLAPLDAQRLFFWTTPRVPAGWTAALPSTHDVGTVVRIR